jgi:hypothetical protein
VLIFSLTVSSATIAYIAPVCLSQQGIGNIRRSGVAFALAYHGTDGDER